MIESGDGDTRYVLMPIRTIAPKAQKPLERAS